MPKFRALTRFLLAIAPCAFLLGSITSCWAQATLGDRLQFDKYDGTFVTLKQSSLTINTVDGDKVIRLVKPDEHLPQLGRGRGTAISVIGFAKTTFLESPMTVCFEAEMDKSGKSSKPLEMIEVISLSGKSDTSKEQITDYDPTSEIASFRITAKIQTIFPEANRLAVIVRDGSKSERIEFVIDPEKTRVHYDLPDLSIAQPGEAIVVRCLPFPEDPPVALEVRVTRPSPFPEDAAQGIAAAPTPASDRNGLNDPEATIQDGEPDESDADNEGVDVDPDADLGANDAPDKVREPTDAEQPDNVVEFDFDPGEANEREIDRRLLALLLGIHKFEPQPAQRDGPADRDEIESRSRRRKNPSGREWYKIN